MVKINGEAKEIAGKNLLEYLKENGYAMSEPPRECYIDVCWNKESVSEYLTEIQIPVDL